MSDKKVYAIATKSELSSDAGWIPGIVRARARYWGVKGLITDRSDAHGTCYRLDYEDGGSAWYDCHELRLV